MKLSLVLGERVVEVEFFYQSVVKLLVHIPIEGWFYREESNLYLPIPQSIISDYSTIRLTGGDVFYDPPRSALGFSLEEQIYPYPVFLAGWYPPEVMESLKELWEGDKERNILARLLIL